MINIVFNNSYQNSYVGFQFSQYFVGLPQPSTDNRTRFLATDTEQLLTNSGCTFAIGRVSNGNICYFVCRGLSVFDSEGREWYINVGIEAGEESKKQFIKILTNILLDFNTFEDEMKNWFAATPEGSLSYCLNYEFIDKYLLDTNQKSIDEIEFYRIDNLYISKYVKLLSNLNNIKTNELLLVVPETTMSYFNRQISFFENFEKHYVFDASVFKGLVRHNKELLTMEGNTKSGAEIPKDNARAHTTNDDTIGEFFEENRNTIELACKIAVGALAIVGTGVLIKKLFF